MHVTHACHPCGQQCMACAKAGKVSPVRQTCWQRTDAGLPVQRGHGVPHACSNANAQIYIPVYLGSGKQQLRCVSIAQRGPLVCMCMLCSVHAARCCEQL